jgi:hypothetical protein
MRLRSARFARLLRGHLDRLAVVYVRQSTPQQVLDHAESTRLQYGLTQRAVDLGWAPSRVLVIDEDLGHSASGLVDRPGFQRLVSEVGLDHVGLVLGVQGADPHATAALHAVRFAAAIPQPAVPATEPPPFPRTAERLLQLMANWREAALELDEFALDPALRLLPGEKDT